MTPPKLLSLMKSCGANAITLFLYAALGGTLFFVPMNLMQIQGFTATQAGAAMIPSVLLLFLLSLAGIPPTAGFIGKYYLFTAAMTWSLSRPPSSMRTR